MTTEAFERMLEQSNWTPDISTVYGLYPPKHRTLAAAGEGAMVNGSWPKMKRQPFENIHDKDDVWTGLEYESACDMINEGLLQEAFIMLRAIHDRYHGAKRNPWNEIEGAEHYSRAMHSWNVLLALSGYTYDGPPGKIGFAPKLTPENFRCFFSVASGWGTFGQSLAEGRKSAWVEVHAGKLQLLELGLDFDTAEATTTLAGQRLDATTEGRSIRFPAPAVIRAGQRLEIET